MSLSTETHPDAAAASHRRLPPLPAGVPAGEVLAVLAAPLVLYVLLRIRLMAPVGLPDPSMHSTFIFDPQAIFDRFSAIFTPTARLREAGRTAFLVPGRLAYLVFGPVGGFAVFRYVLALVATGPLYVLLRRLFGRWAGFAGIAVVLSSPVVLTAWGTDYPDSAALAYLMGGFCLLATAFVAERRLPWTLGGGLLFTLAIWSHGAAVPLVGAVGVVWLAMRLAWQRSGLVRDLAGLIVVFLGATLLLGVLSKLLLGQFDFVTPTIKSAQQLSKGAELAVNHSSSARWAPYDPYLLVPPLALVAFAALLDPRRWRGWSPAIQFVFAGALLELLVFAYLQFIGTFQSLEMHFFSSTLWSSTEVVLAVCVAELGRRAVSGGAFGGEGLLAGVAEDRRFLRLAGPAAAVAGVGMVYWLVRKLGVHLPVITWSPRGLVVCLLVLGALGLWRVFEPRLGVLDATVAALLAIVVLIGGQLLLATATPRHHAKLAGTVYDPYPPLADALGGSDVKDRNIYAVASMLPGFVGSPAYRGEVLLQWEPRKDMAGLQEPMGIYHNAYTWVSGRYPIADRGTRSKFAKWHPAQVLLMQIHGNDFTRAVSALRAYGPIVVRRRTLVSGAYRLRVELLDLRRYIRPSALPRG